MFNIEDEMKRIETVYRAGMGLSPLPPAPISERCEVCGKRSCVCDAESEPRSRMSEREEDIMLDNRGRGADMRGAR